MAPDAPVTYALDGPIATITMDDGKVNALSLHMFQALDAALDRAAQDRAVVVLRGRDGVFSAGFDLGVLRGGGPDAGAMLRAGFELTHRMLSFPQPIVLACTGHAIAMGLFVVLSADYRIGADGPFRLTANEVAIGMTLPFAAVAICHQRLAPAYLHRVAALGEPFGPDRAVEAGLLDEVVPADDVLRVAVETAGRLASIDLDAHAATKRRTRAHALAQVRAAIDDEL